MRIAVIAPPGSPCRPSATAAPSWCSTPCAGSWSGRATTSCCAPAGTARVPSSERGPTTPPSAPTPSPRSPEMRHVLDAYDAVRAWGAEVVHDHTMVGPFHGAQVANLAVVTTNHGPFDEELTALYRRGPRGYRSSPSPTRPRTARDVPIAAVIHHGVDVETAAGRARSGGYALFLGRMIPDKGVDTVAIGWPAPPACRCASPPRCGNGRARVLRTQRRPLLGDGVEYVGEVGRPAQARAARPTPCASSTRSRWAEPFGMVMVEASACGTPVVGHPVRRGSGDRRRRRHRFPAHRRGLAGHRHRRTSPGLDRDRCRGPRGAILHRADGGRPPPLYRAAARRRLGGSPGPAVAGRRRPRSRRSARPAADVTLVEGQTFCIAERGGDIHREPRARPLRARHADLSRLELRLNGHRSSPSRSYIAEPFAAMFVPAAAPNRGRPTPASSRSASATSAGACESGSRHEPRPRPPRPSTIELRVRRRLRRPVRGQGDRVRRQARSRSTRVGARTVVPAAMTAASPPGRHLVLLARERSSRATPDGPRSRPGRVVGAVHRGHRHRRRRRGSSRGSAAGPTTRGGVPDQRLGDMAGEAARASRPTTPSWPRRSDRRPRTSARCGSSIPSTRNARSSPRARHGS